MRRPVTAVMAGLSVAVLGVAVHSSQRPASSTSALAPTGLVAALAAPAAAAGAATPSAPALATALPGRSAPTRSAAPGTTAPRPAASRTAAPVRAGAPSASPRSSATVTVNGPAVDTAYGPVQVQVSLRGGHVVRADATTYPQDTGRSQEINSQAVPMLDAEAVRADSARVDTISGATFTSGGYQQSLQAALDAAHRAGAR